MVELTGYHGTIKEKANKIIEENSYILSNKNSEWLGTGVYFFKDFFWANRWARNASKRWHGEPAVLQSCINCGDCGYFDLDSVDNRQKMQAFLEKFANAKSNKGAPKFKNEAELRCFCCNLYAELNEILVYSCNFPSNGYDDMGFPKTQVQYCVRDNCVIRDTKIWR